MVFDDEEIEYVDLACLKASNEGVLSCYTQTETGTNVTTRKRTNHVEIPANTSEGPGIRMTRTSRQKQRRYNKRHYKKCIRYQVLI